MKKTDRRSFLAKAGLLSLTALSGAALLQACGGGETNEPSDSPAPSPSPAKAESSGEKPLGCEDHNANLSDSDIEVRNSIGYIPQSNKADQNCTNCRFYLADKFEGDCGGCQLFVNGSVNPEGWCKSWAAR